jgi:hypothetical protein
MTRDFSLHPLTLFFSSFPPIQQLQTLNAADKFMKKVYTPYIYAVAEARKELRKGKSGNSTV